MALLCPNQNKFRKIYKQRVKYVLNKQITLNFGFCGIKVLGSFKLSANQIETLRISLRKKLPKGIKIWICIFPLFSLTKKMKQSRMGKGKGKVASWFFPVKAGTVLFEFSMISINRIYKAFNFIKAKLPVPLKLVFFEEGLILSKMFSKNGLKKIRKLKLKKTRVLLKKKSYNIRCL